MSTSTFIVLPVLAASLLASVHAGLGDSYAGAIRTASLNASDEIPGKYIATHLRAAISGWRGKPSFKEIRQLSSALPKENGQLRLEIGDERNRQYKVIWIVGLKEGAIAYYSLGARRVERQLISQSAWQKLVDHISSLGASLDSCKSNLSIDDGSSYFGSLDLQGHKAQFATYGINYFPLRTTEQKNLAKALAPCTEFVDAMFSAIGLRDGPRPINPAS